MPDVSLLIPMALMLVVIGGLAGVIAGLLGVGGGIVLVPAFFYAFQGLGYDSPQIMQVCLATSLATIVVTSIRSGLAHDRRGAMDREILRTWAPGLAVGAILGVLTATRLRSVELQALFGVLGFCVGLYLLLGRQDWRLAEKMPGLVGRSILSPLVGLLSVLMGIGGGSFGVPVMTLCGVPIHRAVGTASGFGLLIAAPSVLGFLLVDIDSPPPFTIGAVNLVAFALVIGTTMLTTPWGVRLAHAMDPRPLKRVFGAFLTVVALNMLRKAWWG
jgi:uncharacterized membrane protein YfcA